MFAVFFLPHDSLHISQLLAFQVPSEAPFTLVYYADLFHKIVSSFLSTEKLAEDSEFQFFLFPPPYRPVNGRGQYKHGFSH